MISLNEKVKYVKFGINKRLGPIAKIGMLGGPKLLTKEKHSVQIFFETNTSFAFPGQKKVSSYLTCTHWIHIENITEVSPFDA